MSAEASHSQRNNGILTRLQSAERITHLKKSRILNFAVASLALLLPASAFAQPPAGAGVQRHEVAAPATAVQTQAAKSEVSSGNSTEVVRPAEPIPVAAPDPAMRASRSTMPIAASVPEPAAVPPAPLPLGKRTGGEIFKHYLYDAFGPIAILGSAFGGLLEHSHNRPPEWLKTPGGYGRRWGSKFGEHVISTSTLYVVSAAFKQDPTYYKCECAGFGRRLGHAIISGITALSEDDKRQFAPGRVLGPLAGGMVSANTWYPDRFGPKDGLRFGAQAFASQFAENIFKEFIFGAKRKP